MYTHIVSIGRFPQTLLQLAPLATVSECVCTCIHTYVKQMRQHMRKCHYYRCLNMQAKMAHFVIFGQH